VKGKQYSQVRQRSRVYAAFYVAADNNLLAAFASARRFHRRLARRADAIVVALALQTRTASRHNNSLRAMVGNWIGPPRDIYIRRLCQYSRPFPTTLVLPAERIDSRTGDATIAKRRGTKSRESDPRTTLN